MTLTDLKRGANISGISGAAPHDINKCGLREKNEAQPLITRPRHISRFGAFFLASTYRFSERVRARCSASSTTCGDATSVLECSLVWFLSVDLLADLSRRAFVDCTKGALFLAEVAVREPERD